ncbi:hypothetical protein F8M41_000018 [Gigaspora margarita]|uniref:Uncharacterized protein n=1 Tax=Gigaspora margarita TaxID=4874 RepID=A0A8H4B5L2_GIGMA|nr:hypothetical protein F8M41_000018 [Gigaspora margarita]
MILLLSLNEEEQVQLILFKITLPNCPKPLFKYTNYITSVNDDLSEGVRNWIRYKKGHELEYAIEQCLILLFLRTSKLKHLSLNGLICDRLILKNLYENTTITFLDIHNNDSGFNSKAMYGLLKTLNKKTTLTSLNIRSIQFVFEGVKLLLEIFYSNTLLNSLDLNCVHMGQNFFARILQ